MEFTHIVADAARAPVATLAELTGGGDVLALAPHPDDESLAMGGAIAAASAAGHAVHVAVVTDGGRSHPSSPSFPPGALAALRRTEVERAVDILTEGRSAPIWLGYPDLAAPEDDAEFARIAARLAPVLPRVTALWTTWNGDPHPDHQRVWHLARWLAGRPPNPRLFACPVWGRVQGPAEGAACHTLRRFPTRDHRGLKSRAVAAHASQMTRLIDDDPDGFCMPAELAAHFVEADEIFMSS